MIFVIRTNLILRYGEGVRVGKDYWWMGSNDLLLYGAIIGLCFICYASV